MGGEPVGGAVLGGSLPVMRITMLGLDYGDERGIFWLLVKLPWLRERWMREDDLGHLHLEILFSALAIYSFSILYNLWLLGTSRGATFILIPGM